MLSAGLRYTESLMKLEGMSKSAWDGQSCVLEVVHVLHKTEKKLRFQDRALERSSRMLPGSERFRWPASASSTPRHGAARMDGGRFERGESSGCTCEEVLELHR